MAKPRIEEYVAAINRLYQTHDATEQSYRMELQSLLRAMLPKVTVVNEPKRSSYGVPDFKLYGGEEVLSYVETKNIGDPDLLGKRQHKEQFDKYKNALCDSLIVFTDYLTFHLYADGELSKTAIIAKEEDGTIVTTSRDKDLATFRDIVEALGHAQPQPIRTPGKLAAVMAAKAKVIASNIEAVLRKEEQDTDEADRKVRLELEAFKKILVHDMDEKQFADFYAQTIVYGLFTARLHDTSPDTFSRLKAAELIPNGYPFLRQIFNIIAIADLHNEVKWLVDDLAKTFRRTDMERVLSNYGKRTGRRDPIVHFYEDFLEAYNPKLRTDLGVWLTPTPIVDFIVGAVDGLLQTEFGLPLGLADNSLVGNQKRHRVQILDPATGTGTFLAQVCEKIKERYKNNMGLWPQDVRDHIVPRINGFEYLMAPYTMAHMKLASSLELDKLGDSQPNRLNIFLTNSLDEYKTEETQFFGRQISEEANAANGIKRESQVMVVVGNPPYNEKSANLSTWIMQMLDDYKQEPGQQRRHVGTNRCTGKKTYKNTLKEKNPKGLNNDYCKFIRLGQMFVDRTQEGILAYITGNTYLDTRLFRGMRYHLMRSFSELYIINLHGSTKRQENNEEHEDECVFNIKVGVAILIGVKRREQRDGRLARVFIKDLYGKRKEKFEYLSTHSLQSVDFKEIHPEAPYFLFKDVVGDEERYAKGFRVDELMPMHVQGFTSGKDDIAIQFDKQDIILLCKDMANPTLTTSYLVNKYGFKDGRDWQLSRAVELLRHNPNWSSLLTEVQYRPFDKRWTLFSKVLVTYPRPLLEQSVLHKQNLSLALGQQGNVMGDVEWDICYVSSLPIEKNIIPRGGAYIFPLYIYDGFLRTPNLAESIVGQLAEAVGMEYVDPQDGEQQPADTFTPVDVMDYVYAVINTPSYRNTYHDFLQSDFPRIPYPNGKEQFKKLVALGRELRLIQTMERVTDAQVFATFPVVGSNVVETKRFEPTDDKAGRIYINDTQYFGNVPETVWQKTIAGYSAADQWLKQRKGRKLTNNEIRTYGRVLFCIQKTAELQDTLDKIAEYDT